MTNYKMTNNPRRWREEEPLEGKDHEEVEPKALEGGEWGGVKTLVDVVTVKEGGMREGLISCGDTWES